MSFQHTSLLYDEEQYHKKFGQRDNSPSMTINHDDDALERYHEYILEQIRNKN